MKQNHLKNAQQMGQDYVKHLNEGQRPEILCVGLLATILEYLAAILDCLEMIKQEGE